MAFCRLGALGADCRVSRAVEQMKRERRVETEISARAICCFLTHILHYIYTPVLLRLTYTSLLYSETGMYTIKLVFLWSVDCG